MLELLPNSKRFWLCYYEMCLKPALRPQTFPPITLHPVVQENIILFLVPSFPPTEKRAPLGHYGIIKDHQLLTYFSLFLMLESA